MDALKHTQRKTGSDPESITYYSDSEENYNNNLRNASSSVANSSTVPAVFKCSNMRFGNNRVI
jgi:hypothetical protein